jgi:hypothetical protein
MSEETNENIPEDDHRPSAALVTKSMPNCVFGGAIEWLKMGGRVAREGWNGRGMFLFLLPAGDGIPTSYIKDPHLKKVIEDEVGGDTFDALGSIRMFTADKKVLTGWLASQTDMLAEDWVLFPMGEEAAG